MKGSLIVIVFFCVGCIMGVFNKFQFDTHTVSMYILYALMLQVGISIGSNKNLKAIISHLHPKMLLIPLGTITGTLLFSALAMMALLGTPLIKKYFGKLAPISAAGVNSMDVLLPSISRYSGKEMIPIAILHGILIDISVPVFVSFFCNL